jgi:hypothetical protein
MKILFALIEVDADMDGRLLNAPDKYNYSPPPYCFVRDDFFIVEIPVIE